MEPSAPARASSHRLTPLGAGECVDLIYAVRGFALYGVLLANLICPWLLQSVYTTGGVTDFRGLFLLPMAAATIAAIALALFFRPPDARPAAGG